MASNKLRTRITYTSEVVDLMSAADVRSAYTSIRHIAKERLARLVKYNYTDRKAYQDAVRNMASFPAMKGLDDATIRQLLLDTSRWLRNPMTKAGAVRSRDIELVKTFRSMGYDFVNRQNINDFLNFLNEHQEAYQERNYDYHKIAQAYGDMVRLNVPRDYLEEHFEQFISAQKSIQRLEPTGDPRADSENLAVALGVKKKPAPKGGLKYNRKRNYGKR